MKTCVIISTKDEKSSAIERTVKSLMDQSTLPDNILICDGSTSTESIKFVDSLNCYPRIDVIRQERNGVGDAKQTLYKSIADDVDCVLTVDIGLEFQQSYIESVVSKHKEYPNADVVTGTGDTTQSEKIIQSNTSGIFLRQSHGSIKKDSLEKVEGWEKNFPREEDHDLIIRLNSIGATSISSPELEPDHYFQNGGRSFSKIMSSPNSPGFLRKYGVRYFYNEPAHVIRDIFCVGLTSTVVAAPIFLLFSQILLLIPMLFYLVIKIGEIVARPYTYRKSIKIAFDPKHTIQNLYRGVSVLQSVYEFWIAGGNLDWNYGGMRKSKSENNP